MPTLDHKLAQRNEEAVLSTITTRICNILTTLFLMLLPSQSNYKMSRANNLSNRIRHYSNVEEIIVRVLRKEALNIRTNLHKSTNSSMEQFKQVRALAEVWPPAAPREIICHKSKETIAKIT